MNCTVVRDRLSEHALGVVVGRDADALDRHLEWCAACRKEARDLRRAAAVLPYALAPVEPPADLEDRIVDAIREQSSRARVDGETPPRSRLASVAVIAAVIAVSALGWGAVMAGRASRLEQSAATAGERTDSLRQFQDLFTQLPFTDADVELGLLGPTSVGDDASGTAATIVVPRADDRVLVVVEGLAAGRAVPYTVVLRGGPEDSLTVGEIRSALIATDGSADFSVAVPEDLRRFDRVVVIDANGDAVLRGALDAQAPVPSPSAVP